MVQATERKLNGKATKDGYLADGNNACATIVDYSSTTGKYGVDAVTRCFTDNLETQYRFICSFDTTFLGGMVVVNAKFYHKVVSVDKSIKWIDDVGWTDDTEYVTRFDYVPDPLDTTVWAFGATEATGSFACVVGWKNISITPAEINTGRAGTKTPGWTDIQVRVSQDVIDYANTAVRRVYKKCVKSVATQDNATEADRPYLLVTYYDPRDPLKRLRRTILRR